MSTSVTTGEIRFSFPNILTPRENDKGEKKYDTTILIPKSDKETVKKIKKAIKAAAEIGASTKYGGKTPKNLKTPLRDGDTEKDLDEYPEFEGHWFLSARSNRKPGAVDEDLEVILDPEKFYGGAYGRIQMNFYPYNFEGKKGVAAGLENAQFLRDGARFGGDGSSPADPRKAFDDGFVPTNSDDDDDYDDDEDDELL